MVGFDLLIVLIMLNERVRRRDANQIWNQGPIAVPIHALVKSLLVQTRVNGELRQDAYILDLIFSILFLIQTLSEGQTLQPGDVLATGTPAGVGIGKKPHVFLKPGDEVQVSVTGLRTLTNTISDSQATSNETMARVGNITHIPIANLSKTLRGIGLTPTNSKKLYYRHLGNSSKTSIIFIHGLGGSSEFYDP